jgi:hypothetical protein
MVVVFEGQKRWIRCNDSDGEWSQRLKMNAHAIKVKGTSDMRG